MQTFYFHFLKTNIIEEKHSAVFSYPQTLFSDGLRNTLCTKYMQALLQDGYRPQNTYASAWWKEVPHLQPVWLLNH